MPLTDTARLAVLIDSDNTSAGIAQDLLEEVAKFGTPTVKRAYGDWTTPQLGRWKDELNRHAIAPVQQFAYTKGKNSTDSALIIDAMDLLYSGHVEGFVLVSSDSDFTRLATRLRESGMTVIGIGRRTTPEAFVAACDRFVFVEVLGRAEDAEPAATESGESVPALPDLRRVLTTALASTSKDDGWSSLGEVGSYLSKSHASFDSRNYGYSKLSDLVRNSSWIDVNEVPGESGFSQIWVRPKPRAAAKRSRSANK